MKKPTSKKTAPGAAKELLQFEHFQMKIEADTNGLKVFAEAHDRHIQKGLDVLIISTPDYNLNFKTTFIPGPGAGQDLRCIIAGELFTLEGMDFTPKDWRAFADKLTTRNARIMEKSVTEEHFEKTLQEQRAASEKTRLEYEKSKDPKIVIRYVISDFTGETLKEPWVANVLATWKRENRKDLLGKLFFPKGHPETPYPKLLENLIFVDRIDRYKAEEGTLTAAIIKEAQRIGLGELTGADFDRAFQKLKSQYERYKKIPTICRVIEGPDYYDLFLYGSKVAIGERSIARATVKIRHPKK